MPLSIAIVGGGIGGLALAHGLMRDARRSGLDRGVRVQVYERDETASARGQGYLLGLNADGIKALRSCCDGEPAVLEKLGGLFGPESIQGIAVCDHNFDTLLSFGVKKHADVDAAARAGPAAALEARAESRGTVDRRRLRSILAESLLQNSPATSTCAGIFYNKQFESYEVLRGGDSGRVRIRFADGSAADADILIGADGARSLVRPQRAPRLRLEPVGFMYLAGYVPFDSGDTTAFPAIRDAVFGSGRPPFLVRACSPSGVSVLVLPFKDEQGQLNMIVAATFEAPNRDADAYMRSSGLTKDEHNPTALQKRIKEIIVDKVSEAGFIAEVVELAKSMPTANVLDKFRVDLHSIVPLTDNPFADGDASSFGRVTLIGDALHAMTPQRGLGANTALLDANDLTDCILSTMSQPGASASAVCRAVSDAEVAIVKRGFANVRASMQSSNLICSKGWTAAIRNVVLRAVSVGAWIAGY
ncbi:hypothetical protein DFJ73DRAFT_803791 [Zopfochytrium polystomum]|nr:hypothetical protein DFJ73DRAFT_803791 [Zopfochytrium polystomum]